MSIKKIQAKRIYDSPAAADGCRMLVDRLWPRGVSKQAAQVNVWAKPITPSNELRRWFHAQPDRLDEFCCRYEAELDQVEEQVAEFVQQCNSENLTLVSAVKDLQQGHVAVLMEYIKKRHL